MRSIRNNNEDNQQLESLERALQNLSPVKPNPEFVNTLRERLSAPQIKVLEQHPLPKVYLVFALGLFIGTLLLWCTRQLFRKKKNSSIPSFEVASSLP